MKSQLRYAFDHIGIPTTTVMPNERYSEKYKMYTADNTGHFPVQWHRFEADSPLHPLIQTRVHIAYRVDSLEAALEGEDILLGPYEPIDGYRVAMINNQGVPVELIETTLSPEEAKARAIAGQGALYRDEST